MFSDVLHNGNRNDQSSDDVMHEGVTTRAGRGGGG